jgi:hypothetical protein
VKSTLIEHWRYCRTWASWYGGVPFAFMAAGLGSAGVSNLKLLETLRPLFIAVAVNCLVVAYRKLGQASIQVCKICSVCMEAQTLRTYRTLFWAIAVLALASIGLPYVFYLLLGSAAGLLSGLFGIGGGIIIVPFLVWLFSAQGFAPESVMLMAVATSLATIIVTAAASLQSHHRLGTVDWPVVTRLVPGVLIGALLGSVVADSLPTDLFKGKTELPNWSLGYLYVPALLCIVTSSRVFAPLGAQLAHKLPAEKLKRFFALLLFAIGMRLLWQAVV